MFSSNPTHHYPQESSDIFSDQNSSISTSHQQLLLHHHTYLVAGMVDQDAHDDHHHIHYDSRITAGSAAGAAKKKFDHRKRSKKIRTAQGLRDRRVRLSIGIARKFFDLQDLLGFDKPSKTVEWLFTKSNKAILKLTAASSSSTISPNKEEAAVLADGYKISLSSPRITTPTCSTTNHIDEQVPCATKQKAAAMLAKDSREKARARARARTVAKLCTSKLDHQNIRLLNIPQVEINCDSTSAYDSEHRHHFSSPVLLKSLSIERRNEEIRKRIIIEHQLQKQQELQPYNYYFSNGLNTNMPIDWDISSVIPQPSSSANQRLNLTRDIEIYSRSNWDHYRSL